MSTFTPARRVARAAAIAASLALLFTVPALAGEIGDENEELEKIVWAVEAESERDPELSVGGETVQVEPGDLITFRIGINEDSVDESYDGVANIDDVYKKADLEYVSSDAEFDPEDCDPPAESSAPADNVVSCRITLGEDGNARLYLTFRVLEPAGNPQACVPGTNVVNTDGASSDAEGADQAQYEICPEGSLAGAASPTPAPSATPAPPAPTPVPTAAALPDTAAANPASPASLALVLLLAGVLGGHTALRLLADRTR